MISGLLCGRPMITSDWKTSGSWEPMGKCLRTGLDSLERCSKRAGPCDRDGMKSGGRVKVETVNESSRVRPAEVVIKGIEVHVWDLTVLLIKLAIAAIPAAFILAFLLGGFWLLFGRLILRSF